VDDQNQPKQSPNVSIPVHLFHQMAACFYGDGPTYADLMGFTTSDAPEIEIPEDDDGGDMDDEAVVRVPTFKVTSSGVGMGASNGVS
jgi:hypothetical protein